MALLQGLDPARYSPRCYVVAQTDRMSGMKADAFEAALAAAAAAAPGQQSGSEKEAGEPGAQPQQRQQEGKEPPAGEGGGVRTRRQAAARHTLPERPPAGLPEKQRQQQPYSVVHIPRSREVGQSFVTSVWTTLWALGHSVGVVLRFRPDVVSAARPAPSASPDASHDASHDASPNALSASPDAEPLHKQRVGSLFAQRWQGFVLAAGWEPVSRGGSGLLFPHLACDTLGM